MPHSPLRAPVGIDRSETDLFTSLTAPMLRSSLACSNPRRPWHVYISTVLSLGDRQRVDESAQDNWKAATEQSFVSWVLAGTYIQRAMGDLAETGTVKS